MRENMGLYRGKRKDNGEWVESHGISRGRPDEKTGYKYYLGSGSGAIVGTNEAGNIVRLDAREDCLYYEVDPDTVGEFADLTDRNGKMIFEDDVVICSLIGDVYHNPHPWNRKRVVFERGAFCLEDRSGDIVPLMNYATGVEIEVIGNVHDNPELREVCRER